MSVCHICGDRPGLYYSCCGDPTDGSRGTGCDHDVGEPTCDECGAAEGWWEAETDDEL